MQTYEGTENLLDERYLEFISRETRDSDKREELRASAGLASLAGSFKQVLAESAKTHHEGAHLSCRNE